MPRAYLIQDPYHPYAQRIVEYLWTQHALKAICLYTDPEEQLWLERDHPLNETAILARVETRPSDLEEVARWLAARHEIVAVLPWLEKSYESALSMMRVLDLDGWNDLQRVSLFRDKFRLKEFLRQHAPGLRINQARMVHGAEDAMRDPPSPRIVLKPNDGFAQVGVAILDADDRAGIQAFFDAHPGPTLREEFVGGEELAINGQCDEDGEPHAWSVIAYFNDSIALPLHDGARTVQPHEPEFDTVVAYAREVVRATGLRRCPFHLEVKVDDQGPCLIECGARPIGMRAAIRYDALHSPRFSALDWAAHHWVSDAPYGDPGLDWSRYGSVANRDLFGSSNTSGRLYRLEGARDVEELPDFVRWLKRPKPGQRVRVHESLFTTAWGVQFQGTDPASLEAQGLACRRSLRLHTEADPVTRAKVFAGRIVNRARMEARKRGLS